MTFKINGVSLLTQPPSEHGWVERNVVDYSGDGVATYPGVRSYKMYWSALTPASMNQLYAFWQGSQPTGVVAELPTLFGATYTYFAYSGCALEEPKYAKYFSEHYIDVTLMVNRIRT